MKFHSFSLKNGIIALIFASIFWGATPSIMKLTLLSIPPFSLAFLRFALAAALLYPFVAHKLHIKKRDLPLLAVTSVCGVSFHIALFFLGLRLTTALNAGIIVASLPLFTLFFAHLMLKEKITFKLFLGACLGLLGIALLIGKNIFIGGISLSPIGDMLILLSTIFFVFFEMTSKKLFSTYNSFVITFYCFAIGAFTFFPPTLIELQQNPLWLSHLSFQAVGGLFYGIFFSSLGAYSLWQWGLSKVSASRVGFFVYIDPIVSTIIAVVVLGEIITPWFIVGAVFVAVGLLIAEGRFHHPHFIKTEHLTIQSAKED